MCSPAHLYRGCRDALVYACLGELFPIHESDDDNDLEASSQDAASPVPSAAGPKASRVTVRSPFSPADLRAMGLAFATIYQSEDWAGLPSVSIAVTPPKSKGGRRPPAVVDGSSRSHSVGVADRSRVGRGEDARTDDHSDDDRYSAARERHRHGHDSVSPGARAHRDRDDGDSPHREPPSSSREASLPGGSSSSGSSSHGAASSGLGSQVPSRQDHDGHVDDDDHHASRIAGGSLKRKRLLTQEEMAAAYRDA